MEILNKVDPSVEEDLSGVKFCIEEDLNEIDRRAQWHQP